MRVPVGQHHVGAELVGHDVLQPEVHEEHAVDRLEVEFPVHSLFPLACDGLRQVVERPLAEVDLLAVLHLHDELLAVLVGAVDVIDDSPVALELGG